MPQFSSAANDTVFVYAPDATRAAAFAFAAEHGVKIAVQWSVRPDGTFDVTARKRGGRRVSCVIDREGARV